MDVLRSLLLISLVLTGAPSAFAYPGDLDIESFTDDHPEGKKSTERAPQSVSETPAATPEKQEAKDAELIFPTYKPEDFQCASTEQYIKTLKFLRSGSPVLMTENTARRVADWVSRACDGAADRFARVLVLLKSVGLSDRGALRQALEFAARPPEVQKNFLEIFSAAFLAEFFDYDYATAISLAYELSKDYQGDPAQAREDFLSLVRFCKDGKKLDLPARLCADYSIRVARLSQFYPKGIREPFQNLYQRFREDRNFNADIKTALELTYGVLKHGPKAPENFFNAYEFAAREDGLAMPHGEAVGFGLKMAARSFKGEEPPLYPQPSVSIRAPANAKTR